MLYTTSILISCSLLLSIGHSAPAQECDDQLPCLSVTRNTTDGGQTYEICLIFDPSQDGCSKQGTISHSCPSDVEADKIEEWGAGEGNAMCNVVSCGESTSFGLKDGKGCKKSGALSESISGVDGISCSYTGGMCGGGNKGDCEWVIPADDCPTPGPTSADTPDPTTADPTPRPTPRPTTADPTPRPTPRPTTPSPTTCESQCPSNDEPVCGSDGQTYDGGCLAVCAGVQPAYTGACTPDPTTAQPTTADPTTADPTTAEPTTAEPTTADPTTAEPTTSEPTTADPTTSEPTTSEPTTASPTTADPTTSNPTTSEPTTADPTTAAPTTAEPTTSEPTTAEPTTSEPTTAEPTTVDPTTAEPTTSDPTTADPTTAEPTTSEPTTADPTTAEPTTSDPTTASPTTSAPTTASPTTAAPTTASPTTSAPTTASPTTASPTTAAPTTAAPTTSAPTTAEPTSAPTYTVCDTDDALNIAFLLDESGSVNIDEWDIITNFVERIITFDVSPISAVSLFEFASYANYEQFQDWTINDDITGQPALINALDRNRYNAGGLTMTWDAVNRVLDEFWSYRRSCTDGCETRSDLFFLITDGEPTGETVCPDMETRMVFEDHIDIVIIIIDPNNNINATLIDCLDINDNQMDVYRLPEFDSDAFTAIEQRIRQKTCNGLNPAIEGWRSDNSTRWRYDDGSFGLGPVPTRSGTGGGGGSNDPGAALANDKQAINNQHYNDNAVSNDGEHDSKSVLIAIGAGIGLLLVVVIALIALYVYKSRNAGKVSFGSASKDNVDGVEIQEMDVEAPYDGFNSPQTVSPSADHVLNGVYADAVQQQQI